MKKNTDHGTGIPMFVINSIARCLLPDIIKFYESEEGKQYFKMWKAEQEKNNNK